MVLKFTDPIEGTWIPFRAELDGAAAPSMALAQMKLVIGMGNYAVFFGREVSDAGTYSVGGEAAFQTLTLTGQHGPNAGRTIPSLFQLTGDRLRVCYGLGGTLPGGFDAPQGTPHYLVTYRREK